LDKITPANKVGKLVALEGMAVDKEEAAAIIEALALEEDPVALTEARLCPTNHVRLKKLTKKKYKIKLEKPKPNFLAREEEAEV
jgi:hypothetical protein